MRIPNLAIYFIVLALMFLGGERHAQAQSSAAMQVCADILLQYGIAPEGCDPQDEVYQKPKPKEEPIVAVEQALSLSSSQQELNENNVFFRQGGDTLDAQALQKLDTLGQILRTDILSSACLRLVGHSDASGPANLNERMGLKRANVVAQYLGQQLGDAARIQEIASSGETELIQGMAPENALHRRVTVYARKCASP